MSNKIDKSLLKLAKDGNYDEIILFLRDKCQRCSLSNIEVYTLMIAEELKQVIETNSSPEAICGVARDLYEALKFKDFEMR